MSNQRDYDQNDNTPLMQAVIDKDILLFLELLKTEDLKYSELKNYRNQKGETIFDIIETSKEIRFLIALEMKIEENASAHFVDKFSKNRQWWVNRTKK